MIQFGAQYAFRDVLSGNNPLVQQPFVCLREVDSEKYSPNDLQDDVVVFSAGERDLVFLTNMDYLKHASNFTFLTQAIEQLKSRNLISQETGLLLQKQLLAMFTPPPEQKR